MTLQTDTLIRKQFFISPDNIKKLERLTKEIKGSSAAKIVRDAIDSYNPNANMKDVEQNELVAIAQTKVKEAIEQTENTIQIVDTCLENLSKRKL
ncbi:MAG: hypothetical protein DRH26_14915 [Deltaproteobacteria bacterium]|nr:MAG: hypothetical protein DRH26_14915 [Deltaproteobacteria bacterium]